LGGDNAVNPFVRIFVIEGEVVLDLPDPDNEGEVSTFLVTPFGMTRIAADIQGRQTHEELPYIPEIFAIPLESIDLAILQILRDDPRTAEINPELFDRLEDAIEWRIAENEIRMQFLQERPAPQIIFASEAEEILPTLPPPATRGEPIRTGTAVSQEERAAAVEALVEYRQSPPEPSAPTTGGTDPATTTPAGAGAGTPGAATGTPTPGAGTPETTTEGEATSTPGTDTSETPGTPDTNSDGGAETQPPQDTAQPQPPAQDTAQPQPQPESCLSLANTSVAPFPRHK
jgi:hypothetical protein